MRIVSHKTRLAHVFYAVGVGLLPLAFFGNLLSGVGTISEEYRTVAILEANPSSVGQWAWSIGILGVLPIGMGLVFVIFHFLLRDKTETEPNMLQLIVGWLLTAFGIYDLLNVYFSHVEALGSAGGFTNAAYIADSLNLIYAGYGFISVLWLVTGIFLWVTSGISRTRELNAVLVLIVAIGVSWLFSSTGIFRLLLLAFVIAVPTAALILLVATLVRR